MWRNISSENSRSSNNFCINLIASTVPKRLKNLRFTFLQVLNCIKGFSCKAIFTALALFFFGAKIFSQARYSVDPQYLKSKTENDNLLSDFRYSYPDTSVAQLHQFFPVNYRGNYGLASPNYILNYRPRNIGFNLCPDVFLQDKFGEDQVQYFSSKGPFADIAGIAGSKQLQALKMIFTQTIREKLNITVRFNRYSSTGFYKRQRSFANNFYLSSNYKNKKSRAGFYFYLLNNNNTSQENGGIVGDTMSVTTYTGNKAIVPVRISSAQRENKEYKVMFNPWLKLNPGSDSLNGMNSYLQIKSRLGFNSYKYKDDRSGTDQYYLLYYVDTAKTYDSSSVLQFVNDIAYTLSKPDKSFGLTMGYRSEINRVHQFFDTLINNDIAFGNFSVKKNLKSDSTGKSNLTFRENFGAQYIFNGKLSGNYRIENRAELYSEKHRSRAYLNLLAENRNPDYIYNAWNSNHFSWNNNFSAQQKVEAELGFDWKKYFSVSVFAQNINHYLFFDQVALPGQLTGNVQNVGVKATINYVFFKHLGVYLQNVFQSSSTQYISLPPEIITGRIYFAGNYYKNNLQMNIGVQAQYYQGFYPYAFMPSTQTFYLQDRMTAGNYPFVDVYLNVRIRPVTFFVKVENALYKYAGNNYSMVPGYYQPDRAVRLGISWMFFD